jgi:type VI secretion system secreted protein Hcp
MLKVRFALASVLTAFLMGAAGGARAGHIFLKLANIPGESTDEKHKDEIELLSFSLGFVNDWLQARGAGASSSGAGVCDALTLTKNIDRASPGLLAAAMTGRHIPQGVLSFTTGGQVSQDYYILTMREIFVTSVRQADSSGGSRVVEQITMMARTYDFLYRAQQSDGSTVEHRFGWDCARNSQLPL